MFDLPEMMQGAIPQDYPETMQSAWLLDGQKGEEKPDGQTTSGPGCTTDPTACVSGDTCDCDQKKKLAIPPFVAGWSTPPPLHVR